MQLQPTDPTNTTAHHPANIAPPQTEKGTQKATTHDRTFGLNQLSKGAKTESTAAENMDDQLMLSILGEAAINADPHHADNEAKKALMTTAIASILAQAGNSALDEMS